MNTEQLASELTGIVTELIGDTLSQANASLATSIASDAARCAAIGDKDGVAEVKARAKAIAEKQGIKTDDAAWMAFNKVLGHVASAAMAGVRAAAVALACLLSGGIV